MKFAINSNLTTEEVYGQILTFESRSLCEKPKINVLIGKFRIDSKRVSVFASFSDTFKRYALNFSSEIKFNALLEYLNKVKRAIRALKTLDQNVIKRGDSKLLICD